MDVRALRYFRAVAEFGSYSRGAEFLGISQPAVSRQVGALETELGRSLFLRHSHGVSLTDAGRMLLERGEAILRQFEQAAADIRRGQDSLSGTVTIALPPAAGSVLAPPLLQRFAAAYPGVFPKIVAGFSRYTHEWMLLGKVDLACLHDPAPQPGFVVTPLVREEVFLVGPSTATAPPRGTVRPRDLAALPLILPGRPNASRRLLDGWLSRDGIQLDIRIEADDHLIIRALVSGGRGFTLLTKGAFEADLERGHLQAWPLRPRAFWDLAMVEAPFSRRTEPASALADIVRTTVRDLLGVKAWPGGTACD